MPNPAGKWIQTPEGYKAFLPDPLPPKITWDLSIVQALSEADLAVGRLAGEGGALPNPHLLIRPFIRKEAVLSSKIEGTQATLGELLASEAGAVVDRSPEDLREVANYVAALEYGIKRLDDLPLSNRLIRELHEILLKNVRGNTATPGEFRRTQNWIGAPGSTLANARFIPPHPAELSNVLGQFEKFVHAKDLPVLVQVALAHYQFEAIHPFLDGNGRVGRLLNTLLLIERQVLPSPILYLSAYFENTRDEYYQRLYTVSVGSKWKDWILYFLKGVKLQAEETVAMARDINKLLETWRRKVAGSSTSNPLLVIDLLAQNPFITTNQVSKKLKIAFTTAQRAIARLEKLKIVGAVDESKRDRVFCARDLLRVLESSKRRA